MYMGEDAHASVNNDALIFHSKYHSRCVWCIYV